MASLILNDTVDQITSLVSKARAVSSLIGAYDPAEHERDTLRDASWAVTAMLDEVTALLPKIQAEA